jgi:hypothetical protein
VVAVDTVTPVMCPWAYHMDVCIGDDTPKCVRQCQNERNLRDAIGMKEMKEPVNGLRRNSLESIQACSD